MQLSPAVLTQATAFAGLGTSMFERLILVGGMDPWMLTFQYRMHPSICSWPSREFYMGKLHCDSPRIRMNYTDKLNELTNRHQMFKKLNDLTLNATRLPQEDFLLLLNIWDDELTEHMTCSEEKCHSYKQDHIEWSPTVGVWLTRRWLLRRFLRFTQGKIKDPRDLI